MNIDGSSEISPGSKKISRRDFLKLGAAAIGGYVTYKYDWILSGLFGTEYETYTE